MVTLKKTIHFYICNIVLQKYFIIFNFFFWQIFFLCITLFNIRLNIKYEYFFNKYLKPWLVAMRNTSYFYPIPLVLKTYIYFQFTLAHFFHLFFRFSLHHLSYLLVFLPSFYFFYLSISLFLSILHPILKVYT